MQTNHKIRLVLWFEDGKRPLRLDHYVESFPNLQLSSLSKLLKDLGISIDSYLDMWDSEGEWMTISVDTVIHIDHNINERVLLRLRPNLRTEILDCPELDDELLMQQNRSKGSAAIANSLSNPAPSRPETFMVDLNEWPRFERQSLPPPSRIDMKMNDRKRIYNPYPHSHHSSSLGRPVRSHICCTPPSSSPCPSSVRPPVRPPSCAVESPHSTTNSRKWPHEFYVCDIQTGIQKMDDLRAADQTLTIPNAFAKSFKNTPFVRTTVYKYIKKWSEINDDIMAEFVAYGRTSRGLCSHLLSVLANCKPLGLDTDRRASSSDDDDSLSSSPSRPIRLCSAPPAFPVSMDE
ncbi:hypothetical protein DXG01_001553 [Tephrocybe rancida]|nr:hypothetical protein DXG01_001553 [Tephrocybe rancida]